MLQEILDNILLHVQSTGEIISELYSYFKSIHDKVIGERDQSKHYLILENVESIALYWYTVWPTKEDDKECIAALQNEIFSIRKNFRPSSSRDRILPVEIEELMLHLDVRFQYGTVLLKDKPLIICLMDCTHREHSGLYSGTRMFDGYIEDLLVIPFKNKGMNFSKKFVFLHELGHALHFRMTHDLHRLPRSFYEFLEAGNAGRPLPEVEMFADLFAVAALYNSPMKKDILPLEISVEAKEAMLEYYLMCIKQHNMIARGRFSFEQMISIYNGDSNADDLYDKIQDDDIFIHPIAPPRNVFYEILNELQKQMEQKNPTDTEAKPVSKKVSTMRKKLNKEYVDLPDVLEIAQVCEILGIGRRKLYALIASQDMQSIKVGRKIILPKVCVIDYMEKKISG